MTPGLLAPVTSTAVPSGSEVAMQPSVTLGGLVLEQCAAWPMNVSTPSVNTKFAVHWPAPSVYVWTPGFTVAVSAGAQAGAAAAGEALASAPARSVGAISRTRRTRRTGASGVGDRDNQ